MRYFSLCLVGCLLTLLVGCSDYSITARYPDTETVYVEVPGETVYVEVPSEEYGDIWVDHFTQPRSVDGVDILWVIDTSGSMNQFDDELIAGIEAMMNALPASGWRLAMTSNDPNKAQQEAQFPLVPGDTVEDAIDMYEAMGRGGREEGFDAAYEYIVNNSYAQTWLRADAALLVVFVSDEEDQSDQYMINVSDFTSWYGSLRGGSTFVSSIVNVEQADSVCSYAPSVINIGYRYMEATNYFGGIIVDICSADWSAGVADASNQLEPHEYWDLTHPVMDQGSIVVFIDGVPNFDFYYEPTENRVYFTIVPPSDALVEIAYHYDGGGSDTGDTGT